MTNLIKFQDQRGVHVPMLDEHGPKRHYYNRFMRDIPDTNVWVTCTNQTLLQSLNLEIVMTHFEGYHDYWYLLDRHDYMRFLDTVEYPLVVMNGLRGT